MTSSEKRVYLFLAENMIPYRHTRHKRVSAISDCTLPESLLGGRMPKNLLLTPRNESEYYLLVMHPESLFRTSLVSRQAGASRLQFAGDKALDTLFHTHSGAVSPFGFLFDTKKRVKLLMDKRLKEDASLIFHPLENTASVLLNADTFLYRVLPLLERTPVWIDMPDIRKEDS